MKNRPYKIFINNKKIINCVSVDEVKETLDNLIKNGNPLLRNVEIFDPITGWDFAANWVELSKQNKK